MTAPTPPQSGVVSTFTDADILLLDRLADALSAFSGQPVLAELGSTDGVAWAAFAVPLGVDEKPADDIVLWQMGGGQTRLLGNAGGLAPRSEDAYDCRLLWVVQVTSTPGERYLKLDAQGEVTAWSDDLAEVLPFQLSLDDEAPWPSDESDPAPTAEDPGPTPQ